MAGKPKHTRKASAYHHGALREALIRAAREILEAEGYEALTLRAAARRVGVSQAAPYNHFADKAALMVAVAAQGFREFAAAMRNEMEAAVDPQARLNATGIGYVAFATSNPGLFKLMFGSSVFKASNDSDLDDARATAYEVLRSAIDSLHSQDPHGSTRAPQGSAQSPRRSPQAPQRSPQEPQHSGQELLESLKSWALVHGLATMINEGTILPSLYGAPSARALAVAILDAAPRGSREGAAVKKNRRK